MKRFMETCVPRFEFGRNWKRYLAGVTEDHITAAQSHLSAFLGTDTLTGRRFLDIGCGSGVHSYAAVRLGASAVVSFDVDTESVDACGQLKAVRAPEAPWDIFLWDILSDRPFPKAGPFDVVYSWGVLHHTGQLWKAVERSLGFVGKGGLFHVALYNKHWTTPFWKIIKRMYVASPCFLQTLWLSLYAAYEKAKNAFRRGEDRARGMTLEIDLHDWLGGTPYEAASSPEVIAFMTERGFQLEKHRPNEGTGCSEFLFRRK